MHLDNIWGSEEPLRVYLPDNEHLAICSVDAQSIVLLDAKSPRVVAAISETPDLTDVRGVYFSEDGRHLLQLNRSGQFFVYDLSTSRRLLGGASVDD